MINPNPSLDHQGSKIELYREFNRLLSAAVISQRFRLLLLSNPAKALEAGYAGEFFRLPGEARRRVAAIQANSLADFAQQLNQGFESMTLASGSGD